MREDSQLTDVWEKHPSFTWRRPNSDCFSTIDRILYRQTSLELLQVKTDWALSFSDHAAVEAEFSSANADKKARSKIVRLDPSLVKEPET